MSYATRSDEMIAAQVAQFQAELTLIQQTQGQYQVHGTAMPHGYLKAIYHPHCYCDTPKAKALIAHTGGHVSNGVPWLLGMEISQGYVLGAYNPQNRSCQPLH